MGWQFGSDVSEGLYSLKFGWLSWTIGICSEEYSWTLVQDSDKYLWPADCEVGFVPVSEEWLGYVRLCDN